MNDRTLMVVAMANVGIGEPVVLAVRFARDDRVDHMVDLMTDQVRKRYPTMYAAMTPTMVREEVNFDVYLVDPDRNSGWPVRLGPWTDWT